MIVNWKSIFHQCAMDYSDTLMFGWWSIPTATSLARVDELLIFCWCWLFIDVWIFHRYGSATSLQLAKGRSLVDVGICNRYLASGSPEWMKGWSLVDVYLSLMLGICDRYSTTTKLMLGICDSYSTTTTLMLGICEPFINSGLAIVLYLSQISQHQWKIKINTRSTFHKL